MFILMVFTISDTEITLITAMSGAVKITDFFLERHTLRGIISPAPEKPSGKSA